MRTTSSWRKENNRNIREKALISLFSTFCLDPPRIAHAQSDQLLFMAQNANGNQRELLQSDTLLDTPPVDCDSRKYFGRFIIVKSFHLLFLRTSYKASFKIEMLIFS